MFGLLFVMSALIDELSWWLTVRQLRRETQEAADRLVYILEEEFGNEYAL